MYPYKIFLGIDFYQIFIFVGIIFALLIIKYLMNKKNIPYEASILFFYYIGISIICGFLGSILFQDIYNFISTGKYKFFSGLTFLGGLVTGIVTFLLLYKFWNTNKTKPYIKEFINLAPISIAVAHGFGRIGCFMVGCCYGKPTNNSFGIIYPVGSMPYNHYGAVNLFPTQLFETLFLFVLAFILYKLINKNFKFNLAIYFISYGIFRFINEIFRGDNRGGFDIIFSPSQILSIILIILGSYQIIYMKIKTKKHQL